MHVLRSVSRPRVRSSHSAGQQVEGSVGVSMLDLAKVMKELGCVSAMSFEGSSSPNMRVNKHETVLNSKAASGSAEKGMQCALVFK